jgi:hypothetical protein
MKLKTLLLGSAAVFSVAGAAQAADLSVAEPVEYVRVCDAFGTTYWYIPGTDTCIKIGGYVRFDVNFHTTNWQAYPTHSASWDFSTKAHLDVTASSMTEYGALTGFLALEAVSSNSDSTNYEIISSPYADGKRLATLDSAWLSLGMLLVGRTGSIYDYSGGFTYNGYDGDADASSDQVRLSWAMSGFGVQLAIDDPRDRWGSNLSTSYSMPTIVGAITMSQATWDGKLSAGFAETGNGSGFGVQAAATFKLDSIAPGDKLLLKGAWAQGQVGAFADGRGAVYANGTTVWSVVGSFQHFWSPTLSSAITAGFTDRPSNQSIGDLTQVKANIVWAPVSGFAAGVEGAYSSTSGNTQTTATSAWTGLIRLQRSW